MTERVAGRPLGTRSKGLAWEKIKRAGPDYDPEQLKKDFGARPTGRYDLYKDPKGNIYIKPKGGAGRGEPTGVNINKLPGDPQ